MRVRPRLVAASVAWTLLMSAASGAVALSDPRPGSSRQAGGVLHGIDGLLYDRAPLVVAGQDDQLFFGPDLDVACGLGKRLDRAMKKMSRLAAILEKSGRRVVFTVAPNKTAVLPGAEVPLPHGVCDSVGIAQQQDGLDHFHDRRYLPLRTSLMGQSHQMFWKTDLHWTTAGGAVFAKELASRLDPRLGRRQHYTYGHETRVGQLNQFRGQLDSAETVETASPADRVKVGTAGGTPAWPGYPQITFHDSWVSSPGSRTWPGRTLILGDSFAWYALENLRPVFGHGEFIWFVHEPLAETLAALRKAHTVVIEVYQTLLPHYPLFSPSVVRAVKQALHAR